MKPLDFWRGGATPRPQGGGTNLPAVPNTLPIEAPEVSSAPRLFRRAAWVIGVGLGLFFLWAAFAPLNRGATAPGRLDMASSRTVVQHLDGGTISEVLVREGEAVRPGQVLARMDAEQVQIMLGQYEQQRKQRLIEQSILQAEMTGSAVNFPAEIISASDANTVAYRGIQLSALQSRRASRAAEKAVLREQIGRLDLQAQGLQGQVESFQGQIELINDEVSGLQSLYERGFASKQRLLALRREGQRLAGERSSTISAISQSRVQQGEARQRMIQVDSRALEAAAQRLAEVEQELAILDDRIAAQRLALNRTDVKAPVAGVVLAKSTTAPGTVVKPGDAIMELVPAGAMIVKAQLFPRDVESVSIGSRAKMRFSGLNMQKTPSLEGTVTYISADTLGDPRTQQPYYEVRLEVPESELSKLKGVPLTAGMPVDVMIDAGARTALAYLVEPMIAIFDRSFRE
jgi:HlyD family type I secretion membrane fusion protein